jgi:hypothetical protein
MTRPSPTSAAIGSGDRTTQLSNPGKDIAAPSPDAQNAL